jgi:scyllo-inositol 2-dehydrogenase (NADP+)
MSTVTRTLNVGFVGLGRVLDFHLPALAESSDRFRLAAVTDLSERRRDEVAAEHGVGAYPSYEALLAEPSVDIVVVTTPPTFHPEHAIQALESGKHVIVEKPMALRAADARRMVEAAERAERMLVVNHNHRFSGFFQYPTIKDALDAGLIGRAYRYDVELMSPWGGYEGSPDYVPHWECKKEHGGGTLFSWGPHLVDLLNFTHGSAPRSVFARLDSNGWEFDGDSNALVVLSYEDGATAEVRISYVSPETFMRFYVRGERGSLNYEPDGDRVTLRTGDIRGGFTPEELPTEPRPQSTLYANLYDAIEHGEPLMIDPRDIAQVIATLEAATISSDEGRVVALSEL